jgi:hypothetical protein
MSNPAVVSARADPRARGDRSAECGITKPVKKTVKDCGVKDYEVKDCQKKSVKLRRNASNPLNSKTTSAHPLRQVFYFMNI